jgi:hypothetical protein
VTGGGGGGGVGLSETTEKKCGSLPTPFRLCCYKSVLKFLGKKKM